MFPHPAAIKHNHLEQKSIIIIILNTKRIAHRNQFQYKAPSNLGLEFQASAKNFINRYDMMNAYIAYCNFHSMA